jgi:hypothetical protein
VEKVQNLHKFGPSLAESAKSQRSLPKDTGTVCALCGEFTFLQWRLECNQDFSLSLEMTSFWIMVLNEQRQSIKAAFA